MRRYVREVGDEHVWVDLARGLQARLHALDACAHLDALRAFPGSLSVGQPLSAQVLQVWLGPRLELSLNCSNLHLLCALRPAALLSHVKCSPVGDSQCILGCCRRRPVCCQQPAWLSRLLKGCCCLQVDKARHEVDLCTVTKELQEGSILPARVADLSGVLARHCHPEHFASAVSACSTGCLEDKVQLACTSHRCVVLCRRRPEAAAQRTRDGSGSSDRHPPWLG